VLLSAGDLRGAIREYEKVREQDVRSPFSAGLVRAYLFANDSTSARKILDAGERVTPQPFQFRMARALFYAHQGNRGQALKQMDAATLKYADLNPLCSIWVAEFYARLGDKEKAVEWFDRSVKKGDARVNFFISNPLLVSIQKHPRFMQILESLKFQRQQRQTKER